MFVNGVECITVGELKAYLDEFSPELPIVFCQFSDYSALTIEDIELLRAEDKQVVYRNGGVKRTYPHEQWGDEEPKYVTVLVFPGN